MSSGLRSRGKPIDTVVEINSNKRKSHKTTKSTISSTINIAKSDTPTIKSRKRNNKATQHVDTNFNSNAVTESTKAATKTCTNCHKHKNLTLIQLDCGDRYCIQCSNKLIQQYIDRIDTLPLDDAIKSIKCFNTLCTYNLSISDLYNLSSVQQQHTLLTAIYNKYTEQLNAQQWCSKCKKRQNTFDVHSYITNSQYNVTTIPITYDNHTCCNNKCKHILCDVCSTSIEQITQQKPTNKRSKAIRPIKIVDKPCINTITQYIYTTLQYLKSITTTTQQTKKRKATKSTTSTKKHKSNAYDSARPSGVGYKDYAYTDEECDELSSPDTAAKREQLQQAEINSDKQIASTLRAITNVLNSDVFEHNVPLTVYSILYSSKLLPTVIQLLRNDSVFDITQRSTLYFAIYALVRVLTQNKQLRSLLYRDSYVVVQLISNMNKQAQYYISHSTDEIQHVDDEALGLCADITDVYQRITATVDIGKHTDYVKPSDITTESQHVTPVKKTYKAKRKSRSLTPTPPIIDILPDPTLLKQLHELKFDTHTILADYEKDVDKSYSYYASVIEHSNKTRECTQRLRKELSTLAGSNTLPDGIYLRVDENRMDVMRCMITGPTNTPYAYGLFLFDIYIPDTYPNKSPSVHFKTTGNNTFRFNPNLYADGMVCLSLLGTWEGPGWSPTTSTILQVLVSLQSMIFVEKPYFNEPEEHDDIYDHYAQAASIHYNRPVRHATLAYAMLDMLQQPIHGFEQVIRSHFTVYKQHILQQITEWTDLNLDKPKSAAVLKYEQLLRDGQNIPSTLFEQLHAENYHFGSISTDLQTRVNQTFTEVVQELNKLLEML